MPSQSRAQRRQKNTRQATRPNQGTPRVVEYDEIDQATLEAAEAEVAATPLVNTQPRQAARSNRQARRPVNRPALEPVDYTQDYAVARSDLIKIIIWSVILFGGMIALKVTGLV
jgi:hypothetical protein